MDGFYGHQFNNSMSSNVYDSLHLHGHNYLDGSESYDHGSSLAEDGSSSYALNINNEHDNVASYNMFAEYVDLSDDQHYEYAGPGSEIRTSDTIAEKTFSLQSPIGASFIGCDSGSNAVSV